ncbi:hypothetical protein B0H10DRAFT_2451070 [Mycena sp. CBHHK59/15]|nr:hypothetical protein B0H10DRAFT_2451070 [Mycena sp. CBHHK59/15]
MQEHMNFWIKTIYQAHGSAASWEWLGMILGSDQGTKHEPANLTTDIHLLMKSLAEHSVYQIKGRVFADGDGSPTPDVIAVGIQQLADSASNPLMEYNAAFKKLQARLRLPPLVDSWSDSEPEAATSSSVAVPASHGPLDTLSAAVPSPVRSIGGAAIDIDLPPVDIGRPEDFEVRRDDSDGSGSDFDGASADGFEDDGLTAFERTMDEADEPTLTRDSAADVALDMDGDDDDFLFSRSIYVNDSDSDSDGYVDDFHDLDYLDD